MEYVFLTTATMLWIDKFDKYPRTDSWISHNHFSKRICLALFHYSRYWRGGNHIFDQVQEPIKLLNSKVQNSLDAKKYSKKSAHNREQLYIVPSRLKKEENRTEKLNFFYQLETQLNCLL